MKNKIIIPVIFFLLGGIFSLIFYLWVIPHIFDKGKMLSNTNYPSLNVGKEVGEKLSQIGIPHRVLNDGTICYSRINEEIVDLAYDYVYKKYMPDWEAVYFAPGPLRDYYVELLKENGIHFIMRKMDGEGNNYILTDPFSDKVVLELRDDVIIHFYGKLPEK